MDNERHGFDEINLTEIIQSIYSYRRFLVIFNIILLIILTIFLILIPNKYETKSIFVVKSDPGATQSSMSLLSGLSSFGLSDLSLQTSEVEKHEIVSAQIQSREFLQHLIRDKDVLINIYAAKGFDKENNQIIFDENIYNIELKSFIDKNQNIISSPDMDDLFIKYLSMINVSRNKQSGIMQLSVIHYSPYFAYELSNLILDSIDRLNRTNKMIEIEDSIKYLEENYISAKESEIKESISALIKSNIEYLMLANVQKEFLIDIIDRAYIPKYKSSPKRANLLFLGMSLSILFSIFVTFIHKYLLLNYRK